MNEISETIVVDLGKLFEKGGFSALTGGSCRHRTGATCPRGSTTPSTPSLLRPETSSVRTQLYSEVRSKAETEGA